MRAVPHVHVEGLGLVDLKPSRPGAVGRVHEAHTQQLVIVVPRPMEDHTGAGQRGDVAVWVGGALEPVTVYMSSHFII